MISRTDFRRLATCLGCTAYLHACATAPGHHGVAAKLDLAGRLYVTGTPGPDYIVIRRGARDAGVLELDDATRGAGADFAFELARVRRIVIVVGDGDDRVVFDDSAGAVPAAVAIEAYGGAGDNTFLGSTGGRDPALVLQELRDLRALGNVASRVQALAADVQAGLTTGLTDLFVRSQDTIRPPAEEMVQRAETIVAAAEALLARAGATATAESDTEVDDAARADEGAPLPEFARLVADATTLVERADTFDAEDERLAGPYTDAFLDRLDELLEDEDDTGSRVDAAIDAFERRQDAFAAEVAAALEGPALWLDARAEREVTAALDALEADAQRDVAGAAEALDAQVDAQLLPAAEDLERRAAALQTQLEALGARAAALAGEVGAVAGRIGPASGVGATSVCGPAAYVCNSATTHVINSWCVAFGTTANDLITVPSSCSFSFSWGNDGDDRMTGASGKDFMIGGDGSDDMRGGSDIDIMFGEAHDDCMEGEADSDLMVGGGGADLMRGGGGTSVTINNLQVELGDVMCGGDCLGGSSDLDDRMHGDKGADLMLGEGCDDEMHGGGADSRVSFDLTQACVVTIDVGDAMFGQAGLDTMFGDGYIDAMFGGAGTDSMEGNDEMDVMLGDDQDDVMLGQGGGGLDLCGTPMAHLGNFMFGDVAGTGNDTMTGGGASDWMWGQGGKDAMSGGGLPDVMFGGSGEDTMNGDGSCDFMWGNKGPDQMHGDNSGIPCFFPVIPPLPLPPFDFMWGGRQADQMWGDNGLDLMFGDECNDLMYGGNGNDMMYGNRDADEMYGERGWDVMLGDTEGDTMSGGSGLDIMSGDLGDDVMYGGPGPDVMLGGGKSDRMFGEAGLDIMSGGPSPDFMSGGSDPDFMRGGGDEDAMQGDSHLDVMRGNGGDDWMQGGSGVDLMSGGRGNDTMYGDSDGDFMFGQSGNDDMHGGLWNDKIRGGGGDDRMYGEEGRDWLRGGRGGDKMYGGTEKDRMWGNRHDDRMCGQDERDLMRGKHGDDSMSGGPGRDLLNGKRGDDVMYGDADADLMRGRSGRDRMSGGDGDDKIRGNRHDDDILGGPGDDRIRGGPGSSDDCDGGGQTGDSLSTCEGGSPTLPLPLPPVNGAEIRGVKYEDLNCNGRREPGEPGLPGVTVWLDVIANGVLDTTEPSAISSYDLPDTALDETGMFAFFDLPAGTYAVLEIVPAGYTQSSGAVTPPLGACDIVTVEIGNCPRCRPNPASSSACEKEACDPTVGVCLPRCLGKAVGEAGQKTLVVTDCECGGPDSTCHAVMTPSGPACAGACGTGEACQATQENGRFCCTCAPAEPCVPAPDAQSCAPSPACASASSVCDPVCVNWDDETSTLLVEDCDCRAPGTCGVDVGAPGGPACGGGCPPDYTCVSSTEPGCIGEGDDICCRCGAQACEPVPDRSECKEHFCPDPLQECIPTVIAVNWSCVGGPTSGAPCITNPDCSGGECKPFHEVVTCTCMDPGACHVAFDANIGASCTGDCPLAVEECDLRVNGNEYSCGCVTPPCSENEEMTACEGGCPGVEPCQPIEVTSQMLCLGGPKAGVPCTSNTDCPSSLCVPVWLLSECDCGDGCHVEFDAQQQPQCIGGCPDTEVCVRDEEDGVVACECDDIECEPNDDATACEPFPCGADVGCVPTEIATALVCQGGLDDGLPCDVDADCDSGDCAPEQSIEECDCTNECHVQPVVLPSGEPSAACVSTCPDPATSCVLGVDGDVTSCNCCECGADLDFDGDPDGAVETVDFEDDPQPGDNLTGNATHLAWLQSKGLNISVSPSGIVWTTTLAGNVGATGVSIGFAEPNFTESAHGLSDSEVATISLACPAHRVTLLLTSIPSSTVNNMPVIVGASAYDANGALLDQQSLTFTGVTNNVLTPGSIDLTAPAVTCDIASVKVRVGPLPGGLYIEQIVLMR